MSTSQSNPDNENNSQGMDRDTFLARFSDFEAARLNTAEAHEEETRAKHSAQQNKPAEVPLPDIKAHPDSLGMDRKIPRQIHIWFAAGLGLLACVAALAQGFLTSKPNTTVNQEQTSSPPIQDSEPPLSKLQQEMAHQRNEEERIQLDQPKGASGTSSRQHRNSGHSIATPTSEVSPAELLADLPGQLPNGKETSYEGMRRYESDKARALITGSKMLAVNHSAMGALGLSDRSSSNLPTQISSFIQSAPKAIKGFAEVLAPRPTLTVNKLTSNSNIPLPALSPRPHASGPLVLEGTAIPCVLLTELRSDLPGMVVAQISEDIFDSLHPEVKVIPRGARLIGRYDSRITSGQQRLLASFHRLILPNGTSVELEKMDSGAPDGSAGLKGEVDTHFWARFGQAFLTAGLARVVQPNTSNNTNNGVVASMLGPNAAGQILIDTTRVDLQASGLLQPTLTIHQGDPFVVMVNRDLALPALSND